MLDDLRDDADFVEEDAPGYEYQESAASSQTQFMGMSPEQRFVIAVMILLSVCILGLFFLLITESLTLPV
ncbi:hypothetical protein ACFLXI_06875 [Chloroflexota bacterium]